MTRHPGHQAAAGHRGDRLQRWPATCHGVEGPRRAFRACAQHLLPDTLHNFHAPHRCCRPLTFRPALFSSSDSA